MALAVTAISAAMLFCPAISLVPIASTIARKKCRGRRCAAVSLATCRQEAHAGDPMLTPIPADRYHEADLPKVFAYPHCYEPHPIARLAADELKEQLVTIALHLDSETSDDNIGKMMGVLVVRYCGDNNDRRLGYLKAHSGTMARSSGTSSFPGDFGRDFFCPPLYDRFEEGGFYARGEQELNEMTKLVERLEHDPQRKKRSDELAAVRESCESRLSAYRKHSKEMQKERRSIRQQKRPHLNEEEFCVVDEKLKQEGAAIQREMKQLKSQIKQEIQEAESAVRDIEKRLEDLKDERRKKSGHLQDELFDRYVFLNILGETQSLLPMFAESGAGDCAAPKLFQHAFAKGYEPVAMAEFWWGKSPANEVRRHDLYYPACRGKCQPILGHMLRGMDVEANPMDDVSKSESDLEILYEDEYCVVVDKPEGMLSAPGRNQFFSVHSIVKEKYPHATGPLLVHRLDQSTSGLLLIAKDKDTHKALAAQFIDRSIQKRYIALLNGELAKNNTKGRISLPLAPDYINRPMQMVSQEGKPAQTIYEVMEVVDGLTRVHLYPVTGRTHQLRVHAAHIQGLDCPIVGDDIYGQRDDRFSRLCLHAEYLQFTHPVTQKRMTFTAPTPF
eukprot:CAMPEP_0181136708 /NCGR_PEP_ID=MMETSP1071-20121207/33316_1 /TAXON_ID=35127 /ORGANISM="Thalassiosira sp., Strain NH16" /LENGTH=615 /DNA_ID=CAMNT_0023223413 /DNA_START=74 /DNA_END=1921 /DNA_ORIENTATION=+